MKSIKFFLCACCCLLLPACKHTEYVTVPDVHNFYHTNTIHDSVDRWHTHKEYINGDTVRIIDSVRIGNYHSGTDTVYQVDSIPVIDTASINQAKRQANAANKEAASYKRLSFLLALVSVFLIGIIMYVSTHDKKR